MLEIAAGDKTAFRDLYEQSYGKVARYVKGFVKDESTVEDVLVQTYTVVWQKAANYKGNARLTTWIIGIARNLAFKEFRKKKPEVPFDEAYCAADKKSYRKAEEQDRNEKTRLAVEALAPKHKEIVELVFFQGLSYPEISEIINIPVNTVKTRVFHAKKALKEKLKKMDITKHDI